MKTPQDFATDAWASTEGNTRPLVDSRTQGPLDPERARNEWEPVPIGQLGPSSPPGWIWPGYIAKGHTTLLTALWKAGKTTLIAHLLHDLHAGGGLVGEPTGIKALVISEESQTLWCGRRDEFDLSDDVHVIVRPFMGKPTFPVWLAFVEYVAALVCERGYGLVVFDTLPSVWPVVNENDASEVGAALMPLNGITRAGAGVLLVHHPSKGASENGSQGRASRGSGALPGFVDVIVEMARNIPEDHHDRRRVLRALGRFDGHPPEAVFELTDTGYIAIGDKADVSRTDRMATIARILPTTGQGWTAEEVHDRWPGQSKPGTRTIQLDLNAGSESGLWTRCGKGRKNEPYCYIRGNRFVSRTPTPLGADDARIGMNVTNGRETP